MNGNYLVSSRVKSPVQVSNKPTKFSTGPDKTMRTVEMDKGIQQPITTRETAPSITLGTSPSNIVAAGPSTNTQVGGM